MPTDKELERRLRRLAREGNVYCRLEVASIDYRGVRLSADDVWNLMRLDDAVSTAALNIAAESIEGDTEQ